jgi:hypothetical protein
MDGRRPVKWEEGDKKEREKGEGLTCGPTSGWLGWRRNMKDDECDRSKYKGENMGEYDGIFRFEGEYEGERVWIV